VLSGRGLCVGLITSPEESHRVSVSESDRESSIMKRPWATGLLGHSKIMFKITVKQQINSRI